MIITGGDIDALEASLNPDSDSDEYGTPQDVFDELNRKYHFVHDLFASAQNFKVADYTTKEQDALVRWKNCWKNGWNFGNPPYSKPNLPRVMEWARSMASAGSAQSSSRGMQ